MKRTPIKPRSKKMQAKLREEAGQVKLLLEACQGLCMTCGQKPDWRGLSKSHTKDRKRFILVCASCHQPLGVHRYLPDEDTSYDVFKEKMLQNPEVRKEYDKLTPKYEEIRKRLEGNNE